jgi:catechol 2,3-dioxygenase-like lactoylglutathione lyase family enzyme
MAIVLDHTIVPAHDKEASARFLARILGLHYEGAASHFAPLRINDTLTLDFDTDDTFEHHHYAFKVGGRVRRHLRPVKAEGIAYGAARALDDMAQSPSRRTRVLFPHPNDHVLEVLTA